MVAIKGMDMPKYCYFCPFNYDGLCYVCGENLREKQLETNGRLKDCPLIEEELEQHISKWVSIDERLPDNGTWVLCYCRGNQYDICHFQKHRNVWFDRSWSCYGQGYVTHWMPLPDQPKGKSDYEI